MAIVIKDKTYLKTGKNLIEYKKRKEDKKKKKRDKSEVPTYEESIDIIYSDLINNLKLVKKKKFTVEGAIKMGYLPKTWESADYY